MLPAHPFPRGGLAAKAFAFVAALILIPALVIGSASYYSMEKRLWDFQSDRLRDLAKEAVLETMQTVVMLESMLEEEARLLVFNDLWETERSRIGFSRIHVHTLDSLLEAQTSNLLGRQVERWARSGSRNSLLLPGRGQPELRSLLLILPLENQPLYVVGELDPELLWPEEKYLYDELRYCIVANGSVALFCPATEVATRLAALADGGMQLRDHELRMQIGEQDFIGRGFTLDAFGGLVIPQMSAAVLQPRELAITESAQYVRVLMPLMVLAVVLAILVSIRLIRRQLTPLRQLSNAASRLAAGNFSESLRIDTGDEFSELGSAFNRMRRSLGRQFRQLAALSRIDSLVLAHSDIDGVLSAALAELSELLEGWDCSLVMLDSDDVSRGRKFCARGGRGEGQSAIQLRGDLVELLNRCARENERIVALTEPPPDLAGPISPGAGCFVAPFCEDSRPVGFVCVSSCEDVVLGNDDREILREFADRIAVASSSLRREERLFIQGHYDALTGLPNRELFGQRLEEVVHARLQDEKMGALLYIDINGFKSINDAEGHSAGDEILRYCAERLSGVIQETDMLARLGGDEFTILVGVIDSEAEVKAVCARIGDTFTEPFQVATRLYYLGASIGVALITRDGVDSEALLKNADTAMYAAKAEGGNAVAFYQPEMSKRIQKRVRADRELRHAFHHGELQMYYQPQVNMRTGDIVGAEALMRWYDPRRGFVSPFEFIALAEENGLIVDIGAWAIEAVCADFNRLSAQGICLPTISVNVSPVQLRDPGFVSIVDDIVPRYAIDPGVLQFEVTETAFVSGNSQTARVFRQLATRGISISIDDFGTGYSSLSYLPKLEFDCLKIDKSFIDELPGDDRSRAVVEAIIAMALGLNKKIVAEGIENQEQADYLLGRQCAIAQGYLYSQAVSVAQLAEFYRETKLSKKQSVGGERTAEPV